MKKIKLVYQLDNMDCGPSCLSMIALHYGKKLDLSVLRDACFITKNGVNLLGIIQAAESVGFDTMSIKLMVSDLIDKDLPFPCILHWNQTHFVVLYKIEKNKISNKVYFYIADPAHGLIKLPEDQFTSIWTASDKGIALFLEPTELFFKQDEYKESNNVSYFLKYLKPFKWKLIAVFITLLLGNAVILFFPFLTQKLVDDGIGPKKINLISLILLGQLVMFFSSTIVEIIRNRLFLYIGSKINIEIISDFLKKLMLMPLKYFETKSIGDLSQRINDHRRIEEFLTSQSILILFSFINFSIFFIVLAYYDWKILGAFLAFTFVAVGWVLFFQSKRKKYDYQKFSMLSDSQNSTFEMITSMNEIKLNAFENFKLNKWNDIQDKLFKINLKTLNIDQIQLSGYEFLNSIKNVFITFLIAKMVITGHLTLGAMFSVTYIVGELNTPIKRLITFFRSFQDAELSFSRLNEIHLKEESAEGEKIDETEIIKEDFIKIKNLSFQYNGPRSPFALKNINITIPRNKVTAIVGASGSGKTTLVKLLLKYDKPSSGEIIIGDNNILDISFEKWRDQFGVVLQDGVVFSETIERNIVTSDEKIDEIKLNSAIKAANLNEFIVNLPLGLKTKIGNSGIGISGGQKQRLLIARAVYKNAPFLFFDEATSSLDSENESVIMDNLNSLFDNKTVVIVAHRLSTVKNSDQIIVLDKGEVAEIGTHNELILLKSKYFNLVKNQLDLGN